jgi:hypothetical protein
MIQQILPTDQQADAALFEVELEDTVRQFICRPRLNPVTQPQIFKHVRRFPMFEKLSDERIIIAVWEAVYQGQARAIVSRRWNVKAKFEGATP